MVILITLIIGIMFGFAGASIFAVNAYEKGYKDGGGFTE